MSGNPEVNIKKCKRAKDKTKQKTSKTDLTAEGRQCKAVSICEKATEGDFSNKNKH